MRMRRSIALAVAVGAFALAAPLAVGGGGSPGVLFGSKGVAAEGGALRYVAFSRNQSTLVAAVLANGGQVARFRWIRGTLGVPIVALDGQTGGLSRDGRTLVLAPANGPTAATSRFAVLDARSLRVRGFVVLAGAFSFDALSPDGKTLYLIETLGRGATYRVRAYDLAAGRLLAGAIVDPKGADEPMVGSAVTRATSFDGRWVYTLYARPEAAPFIHALDAQGRRAVCIDLPWTGPQEVLWKMRLVLKASDSQLVVRTGAGADAVLVDTRTFRARRL